MRRLIIIIIIIENNNNNNNNNNELYLMRGRERLKENNCTPKSEKSVNIWEKKKFVLFLKIDQEKQNVF